MKIIFFLLFGFFAFFAAFGLAFSSFSFWHVARALACVCVCVFLLSAVLRLIITGARSCAKYFPSKLFQHFHCASVFFETKEDAALTNTRAERNCAKWQTIRLLAPAREISCNICDVLLMNATRENGENGIGGCPIMMMPNYWFPFAEQLMVAWSTKILLEEFSSPTVILRRSGEKTSCRRWLDLGSPSAFLLKARVIFRNFSIFN